MTAAFGEVMESVNPQQPLVGLTGNRRRNNPVPATATHENVPVILLQDLRKSSSAVDRVRHSRLLVPQHQPVCRSPAPLTLQPAPDVLEQHVPPEPSGQRLMVQRDAPPAGGTERPEGERAVISEGAEDDGAGGHGAV
jgi:hypothetical protein